MTILIIGGTAQTGSRVAALLDAANYSILLTSRSGQLPAPYNDRGVQFDWDDQSTFGNPFNTAAKSEQTIERVYLVIQDIMDPLPVVRNFLDLAREKGVKRLVLLSSSASLVGENPHGTVHEYIASMPGVEYAVLRPTWFIENFGTFQLRSIRDNNEVFSTAKDGRVPFISASDIAQAAFEALTSEKAWNGDKYIVGPDLFSYDEVAALLSNILGRTIIHKRLTVKEVVTVWLSFGSSKEHAEWVAKIEADNADGADERIVEASNKFVGKMSLVQYFEENKALWMS